MSVRIEIEVKDKHSIVVHEHGDLWLLIEAAEEIKQAVENVIGQYVAVYDKLGGDSHAGHH